MEEVEGTRVIDRSIRLVTPAATAKHIEIVFSVHENLATCYTDAHRVEQIGTAATLFERKITGLDDLIRELKAGRFKAEKLIHPQEASRTT